MAKGKWLERDQPKQALCVLLLQRRVLCFERLSGDAPLFDGVFHWKVPFLFLIFKHYFFKCRFLPLFGLLGWDGVASLGGDDDKCFLLGFFSSRLFVWGKCGALPVLDGGGSEHCPFFILPNG